MRVVMDGPLVGERPSGPAVHLRNLVRSMLDLEPEMRMTSVHASLRRGEEHRASVLRIDERLNRRTTRLPGTLMRSAQERTRLPRQRWFTGPYDVYHQLHTDTDPAVPSRRLIVTLHDVVAARWPAEEGAMSPVAGRLLRRAAAVITVSQYSAERIIETFDLPHEQIHVVPNGVDHERFRPGNADDRKSARAQFSGGRPYVLFAGGRTPRKNLPRLLEAVAEARQTADVDLVLAGPAGSSLALDGARAHSWVHLAGHVADHEMPLLIRGAECLVFPSLEEGFGLPVLEAMASGTPVVTSNASSLPEVAGGHAALVDPMDVASIAAGVDLVVTEASAARAARVAAALEHARGYTWERAAALTLDVYRETAT